MAFYPGEIKIYDEFTGESGGGVPYLNGGVLGKHLAVIPGYFYLAYKGKFLRFASADKSITNINELDFTSFKDDGVNKGNGLAKGRIITFENAHPENNHSFTIDSISEDGRTIYVEEPVFDDDAESADVYDDTIIEAMDFYYNIIPNNSEESYISLTDKGAIQRFTIDGLYASDPSPLNMRISSSSWGWVTNKITNETTGETDEVTVEGGEIVGHKQYFTIRQYFKIAPFALAEQIHNFQDASVIDSFKGANALKYIFRVDGKFDFTDPNIPHTGGISNINGLSNWFNQNNIKSRPEYYFDSVTYKNLDDETLETIDINNITKVAITIKSRNAKFHNTLTFFALDFLYLALNESRYVATPDTTLIQNFLSDRKYMQINTGANGENYGTAYQVLKQIQTTFISASEIKIEFRVDFATEIKTFLKTLPKENRNFFFSVTTQDRLITSTIQTDRVPVLIPLNQIEWDKSNSGLLLAYDNLRAYHFPQIRTHARTSISGYEGDPVYVEFPVQLETLSVGGITPTILKSGFQIVVRKEGKENFILEEKLFDASLVRKLEGVQTIDISESKNFRDMPEEYNVSYIKRDEDFDNDSLKGFLPHHAFVLRYDYWNKLIQDSERFKYDLFKNIENPTEAWNTLQRNGWALALRYVGEVQGYEGISEIFDQYWPVEVKALGEEPDSGPVFTSSVQYLDAETMLVVPGIIAGKKTYIKRTFIGDFSSMPEGYNSFFGYLFADLESIGGLTNKRFGSTEFDSEDDCPFIAPPYTPADGNIPDHSWASRNVRINIFNFTKITVESIYDDNKDGWSFRAGSILIFPRLGLMAGCFILTEEGGYELNERENRINLENCDDTSYSS